MIFLLYIKQNSYQVDIDKKIIYDCSLSSELLQRFL